MIRSLNWSGIVFGAGGGFVLGLGLAALVGGPNAGTLPLAVVQLLAFLAAGFIAGRLSLVGFAAAGGFAGLLLYFGVAVVAITSGAALSGVALVFFGIISLALGSAGGMLAETLRRR
jgi:hypothetical protein